MPRVVALDANLLVLLLVGSVDRDLIGRHKRLSSYVPEDFDTLVGCLARFEQVLVTPNIMTEACNIASQVAEPTREKVLRQVAAFIGSATETYIETRAAVRASTFARLGLADTTVTDGVDVQACVLTVDHNLYQELLRRGRIAVNFNHVRISGWIEA